MTTQTFLIGPIKEGVRKDQRPWAEPEDSFVSLLNAYQFRARIVRRQGYKLLGNLANGTPVMGLKTQENFGVNAQTLIAFDTTTSYEWNGSAFVPLVIAGTSPPVVETWSGTDHDFFYTANYANAFWATNNKPGLNGWMLSLPGGGNTTFIGSSGTGNSATVQVYSTTNMVAVGDYVYFINLSPAVQANAAVLAIVTIAGNPFTVQATNLPTTSTFAWTNGNSSTGMVLDSTQTIAGQDGIRYYGILSTGTGWANYNPPVDLVNALAGALLIFPYKGYLVFLNTSEGNDQGVNNYPNRARWTQLGTPYYSGPQPVFPNTQGIDINAVRDDLFGKGGADDAPTNEVIVGANFIRDILVVYFTRSTWRLRYTNSAQDPFIWERVNIELGSNCTGSTIPFDKGLMGIGNRGIVISDGNDTVRFDEKIPDDIFNIRQSNFGNQRVQGIRTFRSKLNFWTIPSDINSTGTFPDQVLVFNYETKNWAIFDDVFTCFGYLYPVANSETWADLTESWSSYGNKTWGEGEGSAGFETIVAGNQQGYVFTLEQTDGQNDPSLSISVITAANPGVFTSINNNMPDGTWISLTGITVVTSLDGVSLNGRNFKINKTLTTDNDFSISEYKPYAAGNASGTLFTGNIDYVPIIPGSVQINVGTTIVFTDQALDGVLVEASGLGTGLIDYNTGNFSLTFNPSIASSAVNVRVVSYAPNQGLSTVATTGIYPGSGGQIIKISNIGIQTKFFNFFKGNQKSRVSKIDFYVDRTETGQFTVDVLGDSSSVAINTPLSDNPTQNVVVTTANQYQIGLGAETIYRLYCDAVAQTVQLSMYFSDQQMAVTAITRCDVELLAMMFSVRPGGRVI